MSWIAGSILRRPLIVLAYHDLRHADEPQSWLRIEVDSFRDHIKTLRTMGTFVRPDDLDDPPSLQGSGPLFLLTFDDGYINNLRLGVPVLEAMRVHAVHFISTENVVTGRPFWFDRVAHPIQEHRLTRLDLRERGLAEYEFAGSDGEQRWAGIQRLLEDIKQLGDPGDSAVDAVLESIEARWQADRLHGGFRPLTMAELKQLSESRCCSIGSHGNAHVLLTRLDDQSLDQNLTSSRRILEEATGYRVSTLAYPNGTYDVRTAAACRAAGYARAFITRAGIFDSSDEHRW